MSTDCVSHRRSRSAKDVRAHPRRALACREQRQGARPSARPAQIEATDADRHGRHGAAGCLRLTEQLDGAAIGCRTRPCVAWRCRRRAKDMHSRNRWPGIRARGSRRLHLDEGGRGGEPRAPCFRRRCATTLPIAYLCNGQRVPEDLHCGASTTSMAGLRRARAQGARAATRAIAATTPATSAEHTPMREPDSAQGQAETLERLNATRPVKVHRCHRRQGRGRQDHGVDQSGGVDRSSGPGRDAGRCGPGIGQCRCACSGSIPVPFGPCGQAVNALSRTRSSPDPHGLQIVPAASGIKRMATLSPAEHAGHHSRIQRPVSPGRGSGGRYRSGTPRQRLDVQPGGAPCRWSWYATSRPPSPTPMR